MLITKSGNCQYLITPESISESEYLKKLYEVYEAFLKERVPEGGIAEPFNLSDVEYYTEDYNKQSN